MSSIEALYQEVLPSLQKIENWRKPYLLARKISIGAMVLLLGVFFVLPLLVFLFLWITGFTSKYYAVFLGVINSFYTMMAMYIFMPLPFVSMIAAGFAWHFISRINREQQKIMIALLQKISSTLHFNNKIIAPKDLTKSGFFNRGNKKNRAYPLSYGVIEGEIEGVPVEFADMTVLEGKLHWYQMIPIFGTVGMLTWYFLINLKGLFSKSKDLYLYGFKGLFFMAEFNKKIHGHTLVLPDSYEKHIGFLAPAVQEFMRKKQGQLAYLEDPRFEKEFVVYTTDQIEARYILSTTLMEKLVALKQKIGRPLLLSFNNNKMYLALLDNEGVFKVPLSQSALRSEAIQKPYNDLLACTEIVKELQLNKKLW